MSDRTTRRTERTERTGHRPFTTATAVALLTHAGIGPDGAVEVAVHPGTIGAVLPAMPDRIVVVTVTGGAGLDLDGLLDTPRLQVRVRGAQRDPGDAEELALDVDTALLAAVLPADVAGCRVVSCTRGAGRPTVLNPDSGTRPEFTCAYQLRAFAL